MRALRVLARKRPLVAPSGGSEMSAISPLSGDKQTFGKRANNDVSDPLAAIVGLPSSRDTAANRPRAAANRQKPTRGLAHCETSLVALSCFPNLQMARCECAYLSP
jgi:hypothetical protein